MATISLPTPRDPYADKQSEIQVQGQTVGERFQTSPQNSRNLSNISLRKMEIFAASSILFER